MLVGLVIATDVRALLKNTPVSIVRMRIVLFIIAGQGVAASAELGN
jgi:hypothetical protein